MRRFLICSGVHGRPRALEMIEQVVAERQPHGILFAGGVFDTTRQYAVRTTPWEMTHDDVRFLEKFFATLGQLRVFSVVIPGPVDAPLETFLRLGMHAELEYPGVHLAHATFLEKEDVALCGVGGSVTEEHPLGDHTCTRLMAEYSLRPLWTARQPRKILLLAEPPRGPLGGKEASSLIGDLIDCYHPNLCVVGGRSERRGVQRIAKTLIVNPGCLAEGHAAWLDWNRPGEDQVEMLNLRHHLEANVAADIGISD